MSMSRRRLVSIAAASLVSLPMVVGTARGGLKYEYPVYVYSSSDYSVGYGFVGSARNATDSEQYVYCTSTGGYVYCGAADSSGTWAFCSSTNPDLINVGNSVNGDSWVYFSANGVAGECEFIEVDQFSYSAPKGL